jgi:shikimate kinase
VSVEQKPRLVVVGPCGAGKSSLVEALRAEGFNARSCAQEHSHVPDMWQRLSRPDLLIYLDAEAPTISERLHRSDFTGRVLAEQRQRLGHARQHCHLYLQTDGMTKAQVLAEVLRFLGDNPLPRPLSLSDSGGRVGEGGQSS